MLEQKVQELLQQQLSIKLHLGCGPVKLDGYLNVDGEYCAGDPNIVIHNITEAYPIPNNSVDEILSIHVIEHIEHRKVLPMFVEWHRILKPGARVILEWPDLLKACEFIAANPESLISDDNRVLKRSIYTIYGRDYKNQVMRHVYGYSIASMSKLLMESGFSTVRPEDVLYSKTPSDSRVVAYKS